jgi:3-phenylpropionate/trans-cinnamate dioxygenase ferredoxin reductase component
MTIERIVLVGGGQAGAVAARTLRRKGYDGRLTLVGQEPERPYQRPPLSKEYLAGEDADSCGLYLLPESWTEAQQVEVRTGVAALKVSAADGGVLLDDGTTVDADRVLIATGGRPRRLPDASGDRIRYLRTRADSDALRRYLGPGVRLTVIGAGFIGAEVASTARGLGADVTVLEAGPAPLVRALGELLGTACARLPVAAGVDLRLGVDVRSVTQQGEEVLVVTDDGTVVSDLVVVGIGMVPNDEVARDSGIECDNGVLVDEFCRTSMPNVYAAGDVANHYHPLYGERVRVEHFDNASRQGGVAAQNLLGTAVAFDDPHWFWSDQYGANLQQVGHAAPGDDLVIRGDLAGDSWTAFHLRDGAIRAAFAVNRPEDVTVARELIAFGASVPAAVLADEASDLMEIAEDL